MTSKARKQHYNSSSTPMKHIADGRGNPSLRKDEIIPLKEEPAWHAENFAAIVGRFVSATVQSYLPISQYKVSRESSPGPILSGETRDRRTRATRDGSNGAPTAPSHEGGDGRKRKINKALFFSFSDGAGWSSHTFTVAICPCMFLRLSVVFRSSPLHEKSPLHGEISLRKLEIRRHWKQEGNCRE